MFCVSTEEPGVTNPSITFQEDTTRVRFQPTAFIEQYSKRVFFKRLVFQCARNFVSLRVYPLLHESIKPYAVVTLSRFFIFKICVFYNTRPDALFFVHIVTIVRNIMTNSAWSSTDSWVIDNPIHWIAIAVAFEPTGRALCTSARDNSPRRENQPVTRRQTLVVARLNRYLKPIMSIRYG